jgi:putative tricarboxylic transport membrane protein
MLGILMLHGIRPGPTFMLTNPEWLYQIVVALFLSGILFVIIGTYAGKGLVRLFVSTPRTAMAAIVAVLCSLGAYAANISLLDIYTAFFFGVLGVFMKGLGIPVSPLVLGLILGGDLLDVNFRRALLAGKGSIAPFFTRGVSLGLLAFIAAVVFYQYLYPLIRPGRKKDRTVILK